jgi:NADH-quinone oxidoreductase subunit E
VAEAPFDTFPALPWATMLLATALAAVGWWWVRRPEPIDFAMLDAQRRQVDDAVWALKLAGLRSRENEPGRPSSSTWLDAVPAVPAAAAPASEGEALEESPAPPSRDDDCLESTASDADAPEALPARPSVLEGVLAGTSAARGTDGPAACASGIAASTGCHNRLAGPDNGTPDDLKRIKGIGPKLEMLLHHEGIFHFWQIAQWSHDDVDLISSRLRTFTGRIERDGWVRQACALAEPDDLKRIKGIGPKLERLLRDEGIYLFWQIAHWSREDVSSMSSRLPSFKGRIERDGWVRQARALTGVEPSTPPSES